MLQKPDVIAAIATPVGRGGIGIVRLSGVGLSTMAQALTGQPLSPRHATYTPFYDEDGLILDQGVAIYFPSPNSYTGEDVVEFQGHGGTAILQLLLLRCLSLGARLAQPGEFTQRAFLNNKIDLLQAESVADLIDASSVQAARCAMRSLQGDFSTAVHALVEKLIDLRMFIESTLDFPEEELELADVDLCSSKFKLIQDELDRVFNAAQQGSILREGAHIVLVGEPNVGKSSLLNCLSGEEVALVSDIAGTTRDAIRQAINIKGVPLHIIDTAGLRESQDKVELMGMERTKSAMQKADAIILLTDAQHNNDNNFNSILSQVPKNIPRLYVINKVDLLGRKSYVETLNGDIHIYLSAKLNEGIELLREKILQLINWRGEAGLYMARERHIQSLTIVRQILRRAEVEREQLELFAEELRLAQTELSNITGEFSSDDLLGEIFSRFCIGK